MLTRSVEVEPTPETADSRQLRMVASVSNPPTLEEGSEPGRFSASFDASTGVIVLHGELDLAGVPVLAGELDLAIGYEGELVVDLTDLGFIDSVGLGALVRFRNRRAGPYHELALRDPQPRVRRILAVTGLDRVFPISEPTADPPGRGGAAGSY